MSAIVIRLASVNSAIAGPARAFGKVAAVIALIAAALSVPARAQTAGAYKVTNLISDGSVTANFTDPNFVNPWAISASGTWWISAEGKGFNYVIASTPTPGTINFKVVIPPASGTGTGAPSGSVTTAGAAGMILPVNATKANFLFSSLDGTISGWNGKLGTANAVTSIVINNSAAGAVYTGLAIENSATASYILAANFGAGKKIEVYDSTFAPATLTGGTFTDPNLPSNYAPFSVHVLNGKVYVAYAQRTAAAPYFTVDGLGNGAVSVFNTDGSFVSRLATGGNLNSPWGVAIAPANFGIFGGSVLIGNFGNGLINAYDASGGGFRGQLMDGSAKPLAYSTLWELLAGGTAVGNTTSVSGGDPQSVYFTAGLDLEAHGLFGVISNDTTAGTATFGMVAANNSLSIANGATAQTTISIEPIYGFTGNVNLTCSGLPSGAACSFAPVQVASTGNTPSLYSLSISTTKNSALLNDRQSHMAGIAYACLLPFASFFVYRRRRSLMSLGVFRMILFCGMALAGLGVLAGCSSTPTTPAGTSTVTVSAAAGSTTRTTTVTLVVQ